MTKLRYSKLTSKSQTVLPRDVRDRLELKPGDTVRYRMETDFIVIEKARPTERDDPFATFDEWRSEADDKAYADL